VTVLRAYPNNRHGRDGTKREQVKRFRSEISGV
jgi:hypothetical protein